ncbi:MAG: electron transfer flavoprotein subunit beta/FixA family protein [Deltaproteobacteria bacterium]|nr:electron transfer flavoprotein subunit beta/FixA family protein [Deltaproteobacteria bacterium]
MNIVVLCKQVADTESKIKLLDDGSGYNPADIKWVLNPYDEYAVEEALKIKEAGGAEKVIVLAAGPTRFEDALLTSLAMGADEAVLLEDDVFDGADPYVIAKALSTQLKEMEYGLLIAGKQAVDDDMAAVPQMLAELLDIGQITVVSKMEVDGDTVKGWREIEGGAQEVIEGNVPMIASLTKGINEPRYASLPGIMKAKRKPFARKSAADVGFSADDAKTKVIAWSLPQERQAGKVFSGSADDLAERVQEVVKLLAEEAKVI